VHLLEKEDRLFSKASVVNQARLHSGYHYPRSVATAAMSDDNKARFTAEHKGFIHTAFDKYYAVDKYGSFTDAAQFERFCEYLNIRCERDTDNPLFDYDRIEALYKTTEHTFDPFLIAAYYQSVLDSLDNVHVHLQSQIIEAESLNHSWKATYRNITQNQIKTIESDVVINATYAASNAVNDIFGMKNIQLMHEIAEMAFVTSSAIKNVGLTVMDGQYGSIMPYGKSGLLSLSSVAYTHQKVSYDEQPSFDCQEVNLDCKPNFTANCNLCQARPRSNQAKMIAQMSRYFSDKVDIQYFQSMFTIKSKLKANHIDDGRPTEISCLNEKPLYYCLFAGKINSIYEIEKFF